MTRFLLLALTLVFCSGCVAPIAEYNEEDMSIANSTAFGSNASLLVVPGSSTAETAFPSSAQETLLNVDLSSYLIKENIESEIIRVPGNWVITVNTEVIRNPSSPAAVQPIAPVLAELQYGSGGARTQVAFNPIPSAQITVPATNIRLSVRWDRDLYVGGVIPNTIPAEVKVSAFLQRSTGVKNNAYKAFTLGGSGSPFFNFRAPIPTLAKGWSVDGSAIGNLWTASSMTMAGIVYSGPELLAIRAAGNYPLPITGVENTFVWTGPASPADGVLKFYL